MTKSRHVLRPRRFWTPVEVQILRRDYPGRRAEDVARKIGRATCSVHAKAHKLGLRKSASFLASDLSARIRRGKQNPRMIAKRFKPGNVPANKGLRRPGYSPGCMAETQFKTRVASESRNYLPIGSLHLSPKDQYLERKVTDDPSIYPARRWVPVHRLVWIEHNGPVPPGHVIAFKPGRRTNVLDQITIDAIECVPRSEMARRNRMWNIYPREVATAIQLLGTVKRRIRRRERDERKQQESG